MADQMGRERDLVAEDRIRAEARERARRPEMVYVPGGDEGEARGNGDGSGKQLTEYERSERGRLAEWDRVSEQRREEELAASDEREMPVDEERIEYARGDVIGPPLVYTTGRTKT